jgi:hypothetical protein
MQAQSPWLTIHKVYLVLSIIFDVHHRWLLRLVGDEPNGVALFGLEEFDVVTPGISPTWIVRWEGNGSFSLEPEPWGQPGFWERYYDRDPKAVEAFKEEYRKIENHSAAQGT